MKLPDRLTCFLVRVEARPGEKLVSEPHIEKLGYFQELGITARTPEKLVEIVRSHLGQEFGSVLVNIDGISVPDLDGADKDIKDLCGDMTSSTTLRKKTKMRKRKANANSAYPLVAASRCSAQR